MPLSPPCTLGLSRLTTRRCPSASLRLRANPVGLCPPWALPFAPVHPRGGGVRTLRIFPPTQGKSGRAMPALGFALRSSPSELFATAGFPPSRDNHGRLRLPYMVIPRSGPSGLFATARTLLFNTSAPLPQPSPKWCSLCRQWAGTPRCGFPAAATGVHHCPGGRS